MFRPFRLIMLATLSLGVYVGFFQVPDSRPGVADFDPKIVAQREVEAWKAVKGKEEVGAFIAHTMYLREFQRLSWFRSAEAGLEMARTMTQFVGMENRFERVLPNLEGVAMVEKGWKQAKFDAAVVARTQLTWMVTAKNPHLSESSDVAGLMAEEYALRYGVRSEQVYGAAAGRAEAFKLMIRAGTDPEWPMITKLLEESYGALQKSLKGTRELD
jgi:hypothetical protein